MNNIRLLSELQYNVEGRLYNSMSRPKFWVIEDYFQDFGHYVPRNIALPIRGSIGRLYNEQSGRNTET